jgi:hypothetical protein
MMLMELIMLSSQRISIVRAVVDLSVTTMRFVISDSIFLEKEKSRFLTELNLHICRFISNCFRTDRMLDVPNALSCRKNSLYDKN